jgi:hypothetical protein
VPAIFQYSEFRRGWRPACCDGELSASEKTLRLTRER